MYFIMIFALIALLFVLNFLSYRFLNPLIAGRYTFDLNICCGKTQHGKKANVDIFQHDEDIENFILVDNIYALPFENKAFQTTLCAHTIEHVEDPKAFDAELRRISEQVRYIVPPVWDIAAQLNFIEHRWIVLSWKKSHTTLPLMVKNPLFSFYNQFFVQKVKA